MDISRRTALKSLGTLPVAGLGIPLSLTRQEGANQKSVCDLMPYTTALLPKLLFSALSYTKGGAIGALPRIERERSRLAQAVRALQKPDSSQVVRRVIEAVIVGLFAANRIHDDLDNYFAAKLKNAAIPLGEERDDPFLDLAGRYVMQLESSANLADYFATDLQARNLATKEEGDSIRGAAAELLIPMAELQRSLTVYEAKRKEFYPQIAAVKTLLEKVAAVAVQPEGLTRHAVPGLIDTLKQALDILEGIEVRENRDVKVAIVTNCRGILRMLEGNKWGLPESQELMASIAAEFLEADYPRVRRALRGGARNVNAWHVWKFFWLLQINAVAVPEDKLRVIVEHLVDDGVLELRISPGLLGKQICGMVVF